MTKRILTVVCLLLFLFSLTACRTPQPTAPAELEALRPSTAGEYVYFSAKGSNTALRFRLPVDWALEKTDGAYLIKENDNTVGTVTLGAATAHTEEMVEVASDTYKETTITTSTGVFKANGEKAAWYRMSYAYTDDSGKAQQITIDLKNDTMDQTAYKWLKKPEMMPIKDYHVTPSVSLANGNGKKTALIIGNSFVYERYSGIGPTLRDMIATGNKDCQVRVVGVGYASISAYANETASTYKAHIDDIKGGKYGVVFLCGLYSDADVTALSVIKNACHSSNTQLVLFPAHNENETHIAAASAAHGDLTLLNWKARINALIDAGLTREDFCVNDAHGHSNALAGYVGATLIYECLFDTEPPALSAESPYISQSEVDAKLGSITVLPTVLIESKNICYLQ